MIKHEPFMKMQKSQERHWLSASVAGGKSWPKSELTPGSRTCEEPTERPRIRTFWEQPLPPSFFLLKRAPKPPPCARESQGCGTTCPGGDVTFKLTEPRGSVAQCVEKM